ncbi:MAG: selenocysteine protein [Candidatus Abyssobacteria bacterium SURF_5]|uniref:Selenocysteine protein n=1 Tax=Abyssobacteria bacterium (strain SURF_5) TaxID=2093360 RepID=A0A3A4NR51_ABYX5|nr:MAG: selenocysteine protein [Candidatus Abyssubacteria bacterium SURF_5]
MEIISIFRQALLVSFFVFVMMLLVDFVDIATNRRISEMMEGGRWRQYVLTSFLGSTPGCLGAFMNVTLYVHGMISFGAVVGGMIATSGDEAFVMLAQFPGAAMVLFGLLFVFGVVFAWITDKVVPILRIVPREACLQAECERCVSDRNAEDFAGIFATENLSKNLRSLSFTRFLLLILLTSYLVLVTFGIIGAPDWNWKRVTFIILSLCSLYVAAGASEHYLHDHIWEHIIKRHLFRVFFWTFGALLFVHWGLAYLNLESFIRGHMMWVLLIGALIGVIPESGPHMIFVMMYAQGLIPFSVLLTSSFVQDGHGMLPLLSYSVRDSALIKVFNLVFGLSIGAVLFALGM